MQCELSVKNAKLLDRLLQTTKTDHAVVDTVVDLVLQLYTPDLSHYTIIKLSSDFFDSYRPLAKAVDFTLSKLYHADAKSTLIDQDGDTNIIIQRFSHGSYTKESPFLGERGYDITFNADASLKLDLQSIRSLLKPFAGDKVECHFGDRLTIRNETTELSVSVPSVPERKILVNLKTLKRAISCADMFSEHYILFSSDSEAINIVMKSADMLFHSFISVEKV